jgi:hypothetical protein
LTKYLGTAGSGIPPETRVTFGSLEDYAAFQKDPDPLIGKLEQIRVVDDEHGEYALVYTEQEKDKRGEFREVHRGGEYVGGRELNKTEKAELKKLEG